MFIFIRAGAILILIAVMISVATDAFAFFAGKVLGRNKIFPIISPNKTLEGTIGE